MTEREKAMERLKHHTMVTGSDKTAAALRFALSDMEAMAKMEASGVVFDAKTGGFRFNVKPGDVEYGSRDGRLTRRIR